MDVVARFNISYLFYLEVARWNTAMANRLVVPRRMRSLLSKETSPSGYCVFAILSPSRSEVNLMNFAPSCWRRFTHFSVSSMTVALSSSLVVQNLISFLLNLICPRPSNLNTVLTRKSLFVFGITWLFVAIVKTPAASS